MTVTTPYTLRMQMLKIQKKANYNVSGMPAWLRQWWRKQSPARQDRVMMLGPLLAVVLFLLPLIQSNLDNKLPTLAAFFVPYFMFLIIETYFSVRLIHENDPQTP